jgi:hypothetical protein
MTSRTALFALLAMWGVGLGGTLPLRAEDLASEDSAREAKTEAGLPDHGLTNRVWVKSDGDDRPGVIRIFLSDGTLVQDSCWETHRLSKWKMVSETKVSWNEDGLDISARIATLTASKLTLVLNLKGGPVEEHYTAAPVPSVCPDMPK